MDEIKAKQAGEADRFKIGAHDLDSQAAKKTGMLIAAGSVLFFGNTLFVFVPALFESLISIVFVIIDYFLLLTIALELWSVAEKRAISREELQSGLRKSVQRGAWFNSGAYARLTAVFALIPGIVIVKTLKYQASHEMLEPRTAIQTGFLCFVLVVDIWALCYESLTYRRMRNKQAIAPSTVGGVFLIH